MTEDPRFVEARQIWRNHLAKLSDPGPGVRVIDHPLDRCPACMMATALGWFEEWTDAGLAEIERFETYRPGQLRPDGT